MDKLMNDKTRVLITGSNGFLGQKLTDLILERTNFQLCCTSHSENRNPNNEGYEFVKLDLLDTENLINLIDAFQPTHIVHSAALTSVEKCEEDPAYCYQLNVQVVKELTEKCEHDHIHLTFLSTDFVFDGLDGPYHEEAVTNPRNAYGKSKLDAEEVILHSECKAAILRTILVYGIISDPNRSNLVLWAKSKLESKEKIKVVCDQWRMPTWVDDLSLACVLCIEKNATGIYHISSDIMFSILEAVEELADHYHLDKSLIQSITAAEIGQAENRPRKTGFILDKATRELGFVPTSFRDSLTQIAEQFKYFRK